ncbi:hypothetical protein HCU01_01280 [Halomonas cupida]|uniref:Phage integrase family protein n=1 Tax=Halomonas cupida TaxID=44933 RepID=A0A1M7B171_9GAMM|nr:tyrosine-type recombinase/integrase [Halomonas cupida]GEN22179.1 hypothetical protein HCU01_01280 [Halomonas cupida]SHL48752.1 Phage integrase family protein [Halomonas cupida]
MTYHELASLWLAEQHHFKPRTRQRAQQCLDLHLSPAIGNTDIGDLDHPTLWQCLHPLKVRGQMVTLRQCRTLLTATLHHAMSMGLLDRDPTSALRSTLEPHKRQPPNHHRFVSPALLPALLRDIEALDDRISHLALRALVVTTLRPGCLVLACWEHLDLDRMVWYPPAATCKNGRDHSIPVTPRLWDVLQRLPHREGRLFPVHVDTVRDALKRIHWEKEQTLHGFRHIGKTVLEEHGWSTPWIERQLHHISGSVEALYNHAEFIGPRRVMQTWLEDYYYALAQGPLSEHQQRAFAERVKAAITASPAEHVLWNSPENTPKTGHDQDEIRHNRKRTLAPWRNK